MSEYCIVMTTVAGNDDASQIIDAVLKDKLAACVQTTNIGSHYTWKGGLCHEQEILILLKTSWEAYDSLESKLKELHPYETPEIIAVDIERGFSGYLSWMEETIKKSLH